MPLRTALSASGSAHDQACCSSSCRTRAPRSRRPSVTEAAPHPRGRPCSRNRTRAPAKSPMSFNSVNLPLISRSRTAVGVRIAATFSPDTLSVQEGCRNAGQPRHAGPGLEAPGPWAARPENDVQGEQTVAACHEQRDAIAGRVLFEPLIETIGAHAHLIDRDDLIVHVEAGSERRRLAPHLRDEQAAGVDLRRGADPGLGLAVRRSVRPA